MGLPWVRYVLTALVLCLTAYLVYLVAVQFYASRSTPVSQSQPLSESADAGIQGFTYRQTQSGMVQWEVEARLAKVFESEHRASLKDVRIHLFRQAGRDMIIKAENGVIDTHTHNIELNNSETPLSVAFTSGYTIFTQHLSWVNDRQEFRTDAPVEIIQDGLKLTGTGFIGNLDSEEFSILHDVQLHLTS